MNDQVPESVLDRQLALSRVGGDADLLKEIAVIFLEDYPRVLTEIRDAIASADAKRLETSAHALKGSVATFGASTAVGYATQLEAMGRADTMQQTADTLQSLERTLSELRAELEAL